jgi:hypothetical protein
MRVARDAVRRAAPYAAILALGLGLAVALGANLANAYPSRTRPFGWPGASNFDGGVATVRPELVLAGSLPGLLWGLRSRPRPEARPRCLPMVVVGWVADIALVCAAVLVATLIGAWGASDTPADAFWGFFAAHALLALSFYCIGALAAAVVRRHALAAGLAAWVVFAVLLDGFVRWRLFRDAGYDNLAAGRFPSWFYVSEALSPVAGYRAVLILWRRGFRDAVEHAVLDHAALPDWVTASTFALAVAVLWVALPLGLAAVAWWLRIRRLRPRATRHVRRAAIPVPGAVRPKRVHAKPFPAQRWRWRWRPRRTMGQESGPETHGPVHK